MTLQHSMMAIVCVVVAACGGRSTEVIDRDAAMEDAADGGDAVDAPPDAAPPECPPYQEKCSGTCIPISVDPVNCGGCGVTCGPAEVCSAGGCTTTCLAGLVPCNGECVDTETDDRHCNTCGTSCGAGQGCVGGNCTAELPLGMTPPSCAGGGPPVVVDGLAGGEQCLGGIVETTFRWALCSCGDIDSENPFLTDAYDSTNGPYVPGQLGGGVGVNGSFTNSNNTDIWGALYSSSSVGGVSTANMTSIKQELHVGGPLNVNNPFTVGADVYVAGDIDYSATISIAGDLYHPNGALLVGPDPVSSFVTYQSYIRTPVTVDPPCDCAPDKILPIANIVAAHRTNNDNALIGLSPDALADVNQPLRVDLPCGRYYLSGIDTNSPLTIHATGRTALFIDGDVVTGAPLAFTVAPTGELDVFIADKLVTTAKMTIGSPNFPALTRIYVGGVGPSVTLTNDVVIAGFLYMARGAFAAGNPLTVFGGLITGDFRNSNSTAIHYDRQVLEAGDACPPEPPQCTSCADCGNQACNAGTCGACTSNADCCAPLTCSMGECVIVIN